MRTSSPPAAADPVAGSGTGRRARATVITEAWAALGADVEALSNPAGRPLARTVKLILDPLVIRPVQNPHLAGSALDPAAASELTARIHGARDDLAATAAWFPELKRARRALGVTEGNPQDLYFQRCFELARSTGMPGPDAAAIAASTVSEVQQETGGSLLTRIRALLEDDAERAILDASLADAWTAAAPLPSPTPDADALAQRFLDVCVEEPDDADASFTALVATASGTASAAGHAAPGAARDLGLTAHETIPVPRLGGTATKRDLPLPFDRSVFERLFAALSSGSPRELPSDAADLLADEIARSAAPWQLADERSRVVMMLGRESGQALGPSASPRPARGVRLLHGRWSREAYVRRVLRLPGDASGVPESLRDDVRDARRAYLRRLWVRVHGRELRGRPPVADEVWDLLDGVLRSVIMDQRHRVKAALGRDLPGAA
ncbi:MULTISPECIES: hypothetical protein [unclassified Microbacterium]|uniref:hypothetical protein n=1 Tax=unclassified Microbacterium TaxID=2609290 RepID=UPI0030100D4E